MEEKFAMSIKIPGEINHDFCRRRPKDSMKFFNNNPDFDFFFSSSSDELIFLYQVVDVISDT